MRRPTRALLVVAALLAERALAQGVAVSGTVRDSIGGGPLAGALVQLVADSANAMPRTVVADSSGRYRIDGVSRGRYVISFLHPLLDSLTLEPTLHSLEVLGTQPVTYDLATPSGARLRAAFCGPRTATATGGAFVGVVRDAGSSEPIPGVSVVAEWVDMVIARGGVSRSLARRAATTSANGWFSLCDVPGPGNLSIHARRGADTTDVLAFTVPASLFARHDLYLGRSGSAGRATGRVVNEKGEPLSSAIVRIGAASTRAGADGAWVLSNIATGTRILDVRAIGYYPERRPVDVTAEPVFVSVQMATFQSVLDTMRVQASMADGDDRAGFERRRRAAGSGRFLTEEDIRRRAPTEASDIFRSIPGLYVGDKLTMRSGGFSSFGSGGLGECAPAIFIDGHLMPGLSSDGEGAGMKLDDLNSWISPHQIASMEIYYDVVPPQFQVALSGCGSVVIWRKKPPTVRKPPGS